MIGHALLRQTEVLLNSMDNIVARVVRSVLAGEYQQDTGPVINPHVGEKRFYTRPLNIPQINAPEGTKAEFILYAPEDQNDRPTRLLSYQRDTTVCSGTGIYGPARSLPADRSRSRPLVPILTRLPPERSPQIKTYWCGRPCIVLAAVSQILHIKLYILTSRRFGASFFLLNFTYPFFLTSN